MEKGVQLISTSAEEFSGMIAQHLSNQINEIKESIPQNDQLLTRDQTAKLFDVNVSTIHHWTKAKKIIAYGIRGRVYYKRSELDAALIPINSKG